jgi:hypothetical protein
MTDDLKQRLADTLELHRQKCPGEAVPTRIQLLIDDLNDVENTLNNRIGCQCLNCVGRELQSQRWIRSTLRNALIYWKHDLGQPEPPPVELEPLSGYFRD